MSQMKQWDVPMLGPDINTQIYILHMYTRFMRTQFPGARLDPFWAGIFGPIVLNGVENFI